MTPDPFGMALLDALDGGGGWHTLERDDGVTEAMPADPYFSEAADWPPDHRTAVDALRGRVLDVGAGAGRHSLHLQANGAEPVALDTSPGAIEVCRRRGVRQTFLGSMEQLAATNPEPFEAAILMGHDLAIVGSEAGAAGFFGSLRRLLRPGGTVIGTGLDPYLTDEPRNLAYHEWNRRRGRMPGQVRMRVRYQFLVGAWFDWLFLSPAELSDLASRSAWAVDEITQPDPTYLAVLRPT